jgi:hypothetical protein
MSPAGWQHRFAEWVRDRLHIRRIRNEYLHKPDQVIDPRRLSNSERAVFDAFLQRIADRIQRRSRQLGREAEATQRARATHEQARLAATELEEDPRTEDTVWEYRTLTRQSLTLKTEGDEGELSHAFAFVNDAVLFLADFAFMLFVLTKGIDVPFPGSPQFGQEDLAGDIIKFLGAITLSLIGPTIVITSARHIGTKLADRRARSVLGQRSSASPHSDQTADSPMGEVAPEEDTVAGSPWRATLLRLGRFGRWLGQVIQKNATIILAGALVLLVALVYWYTATARLEVEERLSDNLAKGVTMLLLGLPPATVLTHISVERSSKHRASRRATRAYKDLAGDRHKRAAATASTADAWRQAWLRAAQRVADIRAEMVVAMAMEYPRFERLVLLARAQTDHAPLYQSIGSANAVDADWWRWFANARLPRDPKLMSQMDGLIQTIAFLETLRPPDMQPVPAVDELGSPHAGEGRDPWPETHDEPRLTLLDHERLRAATHPYEPGALGPLSGHDGLMVAVREPPSWRRSADQFGAGEADSRDLSELSVFVYLDTEDQEAIGRITTRLDQMVDSLGYDGPHIIETQRGSFIRRSRAFLRGGLSSDEVRTRLIKIERALELATLDVRQADVNVKTASAVAGLLAALNTVDRAVMKVESILLLKYVTPQGPIVLTRTLSQIELRALEKYPEIQLNPEQALRALAAAVESMGEL